MSNGASLDVTITWENLEPKIEQMDGKFNINDLAKKLGVSPVHAGRVLNKKPARMRRQNAINLAEFFGLEFEDILPKNSSQADPKTTGGDIINNSVKNLYGTLITGKNTVYKQINIQSQNLGKFPKDGF